MKEAIKRNRMKSQMQPEQEPLEDEETFNMKEFAKQEKAIQ